VFLCARDSSRVPPIYSVPLRTPLSYFVVVQAIYVESKCFEVGMICSLRKCLFAIQQGQLFFDTQPSHIRELDNRERERERDFLFQIMHVRTTVYR
jgi:hypothetical protein